MTVNLILWRHAIAEDLTLMPEIKKTDLERELTPKGHKQARVMASWLHRHAPKKPRILVSPATRTCQTIAPLAKQFEICPVLSPVHNAADLLHFIDWPHLTEGNFIVVGHQPTLGQAAAYLMTGKEDDWSVKKGSIWWFVKREREGIWQTVLKTVLTAEQIELPKS